MIPLTMLAIIYTFWIIIYALTKHDTSLFTPDITLCKRLHVVGATKKLKLHEKTK